MSRHRTTPILPDSLDALALLSLQAQPARETKMYGSVRPIAIQRRCPVCNQPFKEVSKTGFICLEHQTQPHKFFVDLWNPRVKKRITIFRDEKGMVLDSYKRAYEVLTKASREIEDKKFNPERYRQEDPKQFYITTCWDEYSKRGLKQSYLQNLKYTRPKVIVFFGESKDIRELSQSDVAQFMQHLINVTHMNYEGAKQNIRVFLSVVNYYAKLGIGTPLTMTTVMDIEKNKNKKARKLKNRIPEIQESLKVIACMEPQDRLPYLFNLLHFCRPADVRALQAGDFNFTDNTVMIQRSFSIDELHDLTKTGHEYLLPIHPQVLEPLRSLCMTKNPDEFLWTMPTGKNQGKPWKMYYQHDLWQAARTKAGTPTIEMYKGLKHAGASEVADNSKDILGTSKLMGHFGGTSNTEKYIKRRSVEKLRAVQQHITIPVDILD